MECNLKDVQAVNSFEFELSTSIKANNVFDEAVHSNPGIVVKSKLGRKMVQAMLLERIERGTPHVDRDGENL